jgi:hypothetical protein
MLYKEIEEIIDNAFRKQINHLQNSLGNTREKGQLHFKQKAIDKLENIMEEVKRDICYEMTGDII